MKVDLGLTCRTLKAFVTTDSPQNEKGDFPKTREPEACPEHAWNMCIISCNTLALHVPEVSDIPNVSKYNKHGKNMKRLRTWIPNKTNISIPTAQRALTVTVKTSS